MTLRGNPLLLLSRDWSASLRVCAVVFVYVGWGHVSRSDGAVAKVQGEPFLLRHLFFLPDWLQRFSCIFTVGCCGMWRRALALKHVCVCSLAYGHTRAHVQWRNEIAVGVESERFHLRRLLSSSSSLLSECQRWMLCWSPPVDKIRTTCSSYLLAKGVPGGPADARTSLLLPPPPPLPASASCQESEK